MSGPSLELATLYQPVREGMEAVDARLTGLDHSHFPSLPPLLEHTLKHRGKRLRPALTLLAGQLYRYDPTTVPSMAAAMELFHTATLVHDDIVDGSSLRRGRPTANKVWGEGAALLLGDYLFAAAAELVASTRNLQVIHLFAQMLMTISASELGQSLASPERRLDYGHYLDWIGAKTASVFATATQSGAILGGAPEGAVAALRDYGHNLGIAFQMVDDILDFTGEEEALGKPVGADLVGGHPTLPTILFLERHPEGGKLRQLLSQGADPEELRQLAELISRSGLMEECYAVARDFASRASRTLKGLPDTEGRRSLELLADYTFSRRR